MRSFRACFVGRITVAGGHALPRHRASETVFMHRLRIKERRLDAGPLAATRLVEGVRQLGHRAHRHVFEGLWISAETHGSLGIEIDHCVPTEGCLGHIPIEARPDQTSACDCA
jgi:hypothetical protein